MSGSPCEGPPGQLWGKYKVCLHLGCQQPDLTWHAPCEELSSRSRRPVKHRRKCATGEPASRPRHGEPTSAACLHTPLPCQINAAHLNATCLAVCLCLLCKWVSVYSGLSSKEGSRLLSACIPATLRYERSGAAVGLQASIFPLEGVFTRLMSQDHFVHTRRGVSGAGEGPGQGDLRSGGRSPGHAWGQQDRGGRLCCTRPHLPAPAKGAAASWDSLLWGRPLRPSPRDTGIWTQVCTVTKVWGSL